MSKQPFLPLFFGDFLASTAEWTGEERSLYLTLLGYQWSLGSLPIDGQKVRRVVQWDRKLFASCWPTVSEKFVEQDGRLVNPRLEQHRGRSVEIATIRAEIGRKGGLAKASGKHKANGKQLPEQQPSNSQELATANSCHPSHPIPEEDQNPPTPRLRGASASHRTTIPDNFAVDEPLARYAAERLPDVDVAELGEKFRAQALAKGWTNADWRRAFQTYVRNCAPKSGHWAAGQYPRAAGVIQWQ